MTNTAQSFLFQASALGLLALTASITIAHRAPERVAYVNVSRVVQESQVSKRGAADINAWLDGQRQVIGVAFSEAKKLEDAKDGKAKDKLAEAQRMGSQMNEDLNQRNKKLGLAIRDRVVAVSKNLATVRGFDVVLQGDQALYARLDLTDDVLKAIDAGADVGMLDEDLAGAKAERDRLQRELDAMKARAAIRDGGAGGAPKK